MSKSARPPKNVATGAEAEALRKQLEERNKVLFGVPDDFDEKKLQRRNLPRILRPSDVPMGGVVAGEIMAIVDSPVSTIKGKLIQIRHKSGEEFLLPCTGVIRQALAPGREKDEAALKKQLEAEVGKNIFCKRLPDQLSTKYKKDMFMFDVFTSKK